MKHKKIMTIIAFLLLGLAGLYAQEGLTASGGEATGAGGTASYSVGQVFYTSNTGSTGIVSQGVIQPFEVYIILGIEETEIYLEMSAYPNPTSNYLTLKTGNNAHFSYQLYDMQGRIIENKKVTTTDTTISMETLPTATYFLKVTKDSQLVKTFKIIKN